MRPRYCGYDSTRNRITPQGNAVISATGRFSHRNGPRHTAVTFPVQSRSIFLSKLNLNLILRPQGPPTWVQTWKIKNEKTHLYVFALLLLWYLWSVDRDSVSHPWIYCVTCGRGVPHVLVCRSIVPLSPFASFDLWGRGSWLLAAGSELREWPLSLAKIAICAGRVRAN